jgi:Flp pilus assembly protein TadG
VTRCLVATDSSAAPQCLSFRLSFRSSFRLSFRECAQATVEFALILPLVLLVFVLGIDGVLMARDELLVVHSAREGARVASVTGDLAQATVAAKSRGAPSDATVSLVRVGGGTNELVTVNVTWSLANRLLLLGPVGRAMTVGHSVTMRRESRPIA